MKTKCNPLKLNETRFLKRARKQDGRYVKRYFFSNGLGASVVCHDHSYGGHAGYFELALLKYRHQTDPEMTFEIVQNEHPIKERHGVADVWGWLDFHEVAAILQEIRNYNTGDYWINERT